MSFGLTKEQIDIQRAAREFAEGEFRPIARASDSKEMFDDRLWKKAANHDGSRQSYLLSCCVKA